MPIPSESLLPDAGLYPGDESDTALVLDPSEVADAERVELLLNDGPIRVAPPGPDWGDAQIQAYMADLAVGSSPVDYRIPNRQIRVPLLLGADGPDGFDAARLALQSKVALIQREGGWLRRGDDPLLCADVVNATLTLPEQYAHLGVEADVMLTLEVLPDFYGDEQTLTAHPSSSGELVFTEPVIGGDHPGRLRLQLTEGSGHDQLGLLYGLRCRHYSSAATTRLVYEAEAMTALDAAAIATLSGASGGGSNNTVKHASLAADWTPVLSTDLLSGGPMTHTGSYRVWARVYSTSDTPPQARFVWAVGDLAAATENAPAAIPAANGFYLLDLGEIRIDPVAVGPKRWRGVVQGKGAVGGEDLSIDKLWLQPLDEGAGRVAVNVAPSITGLETYAAVDHFDQSAGNLNGKAANVGGNWTTSGDPTDFAVDSTNHVASRSEISDASLLVGRFGIVGASLSAVLAKVDLTLAMDPGTAHTQRQGLLLRYVDANNFAYFGIRNDGGHLYRLMLTKVVAGVETVVHFLDTYDVRSLPPDQVQTVICSIDGSGKWSLTESVLNRTASGQDADLAAGGLLASGHVGIYDANTTTHVSTRSFDNFSATPLTTDAALFANRTAEIRFDSFIREDADGSAYGPKVPIGDLPRIPPSGTEARPIEVFVKATRGDLDQLPDSGGGDAISAQVTYRPCWLFRP